MNSLNIPLSDQFCASIAMVRNAIGAFPVEQWDVAKPYWYNAYHCLFFTDFYLTKDANDFDPPHGLGEFDEVLPDPWPSRDDLLAYADALTAKCRERTGLLDEEIAAGYVWFNQSRTRSFPILEMHLYNMRHVQHHAAQLNLLLRQDGVEPPDWISRATED